MERSKRVLNFKCIGPYTRAPILPTYNGIPNIKKGWYNYHIIREYMCFFLIYIVNCNLKIILRFKTHS